VDGPPHERYPLVVSEESPPKRLYRAMKRDSDGMPLCGAKANELGVRPGIDIEEDAEGLVHPKTGGLSTTPDDPDLLPPHVRPASHGGKGKLPVFVLEVAVLDAQLSARRDPKSPRRHAFIEPAASKALTALQALFCSGRADWEVVS
jgi:hypothetical protein